MDHFTNAGDPAFKRFCRELDQLVGLKGANNRAGKSIRRPIYTSPQGGNGQQFNNFGGGTQSLIESNYFEAGGNQHFGVIGPQKRASRAAPTLSRLEIWSCHLLGLKVVNPTPYFGAYRALKTCCLFDRNPRKAIVSLYLILIKLDSMWSSHAHTHCS
jgi:hypothetical protein